MAKRGFVDLGAWEHLFLSPSRHSYRFPGVPISLSRHFGLRRNDGCILERRRVSE